MPGTLPCDSKIHLGGESSELGFDSVFESPSERRFENSFENSFGNSFGQL